MRIGVLGAGFISRRYLSNASWFRGVEFVACADLMPGRAEELAGAFGIKAVSTNALLAADDIEIILNLTNPLSHVGTSHEAIKAGKHVYTEKPLALTREDGQALLSLASERGVRIGSAPDTFLGAGLRACRGVLDSGRLGELVGVSARWTCPGHEFWHPNPDFYYQPGGGPLHDMGPYVLTALITLLGPVVSVTAFASRARDTRVIAVGPRRGEVIPVDVATHVGGLLRFESGVIGNVTFSFETALSSAPFIEIHGTRGSLRGPDPDAFDGPVATCMVGSETWVAEPVSQLIAGNSRGAGLAEMIEAIEERRPHRASGSLALHVTDIMESLLASAGAGGAAVSLRTSVDRPEPLREENVMTLLSEEGLQR